MKWKRREQVDAEWNAAPRDVVLVRIRPDGSKFRSRPTTRQAAEATMSHEPRVFWQLERLRVFYKPELQEVHDDDGNRVVWLEPATEEDRA